MNATGEDIARVTIIAPHRRIDLALPGEALLGEILPTIVRFAGQEAAPTGEAVHTWVLQRVGEDALDPNKLVSALGIRDGETLHLRQREAALPDAAFDDVVDAVSTTSSSRPSWMPVHSMRVALGALLVLLVGGSFLTLLTDHSLGSVAAVFVIGLAAGVGAIVASRAFGRKPVAAALAWACVAISTLAGFHLLAPMNSEAESLLAEPALPLMLLIAMALGLVSAAVMALAASVHVHALLTTCITFLLLAVVGVAMAFLPQYPVQICAVAVAILLAITPALPSLSYSIAQIAMPNLPSQVELLMADDQPVQSDIVERATTADRLLACFLAASSIATTLLCIPIVLMGTVPSLLLATAVALAMLLRARGFVGLTQRLVMLLGGLAVAAMTAAWLLMHPDTGVLRLLVAVLVMALLGWILAQYAGSFYARIMAPVWGRFGDIIEWIAIIAIIPLVLWILDLYAFARGLKG